MYSFRLILIFLNICAFALSSVRFTNLKCEALDATFVTFPTCNIKMVKRGVSAMNIYAKLHQLPVTQSSVKFSLSKKANGYKPFLYNFTVDFCDFSRNRKKYPVMDVFLNIFMSHSNINHTCPYNHDLIVKNLVLKDEMLSRLPLPDGDYMINLLVFAYKTPRGDIKVYIERKEGK